MDSYFDRRNSSSIHIPWSKAINASKAKKRTNKAERGKHCFVDEDSKFDKCDVYGKCFRRREYIGEGETEERRKMITFIEKRHENPSLKVIILIISDENRHWKRSAWLVMIFVFIDDSVERKWKDRKADSSANEDGKSSFMQWLEGNVNVEVNSTTCTCRKTTRSAIPISVFLRRIRYWWTNTTRVYIDQSNDVGGNASTAVCEWATKREFSSEDEDQEYKNWTDTNILKDKRHWMRSISPLCFIRAFRSFSLDSVKFFIWKSFNRLQSSIQFEQWQWSVDRRSSTSRFGWCEKWLENEKFVCFRELFIDQQIFFDDIRNDYSILGLEITWRVN